MSVQLDHEVMEFDQDAANWVALYKDTLAQIKQLQEQADVARANIEAAMGVCEVGLFNNRPLVRWTTVNTSRLDVKKIKEIISAEQYADFSQVTTSRRFVIVSEEV